MASTRCDFPAPWTARSRAFSPGFRTPLRASYDRDIRTYLPHHPLFAVVADFDGDGRLDVAVLGDVGLVAIFNLANAPRATCIDTCRSTASFDNQYPLITYIELQPKGKIEIPNFDDDGPSGSLTLDHDGVELIYFQKAAVMYYWAGANWKSVTTAD